MITDHDQTIVHVLFVPDGWEIGAVVDELNVFGVLDLGCRRRWWQRLKGHWEVYECDGSPCRCPAASYSLDMVVRHNGKVVSDGCDLARFPVLCRVSRFVRGKVGR